MHYQAEVDRLYGIGNGLIYTGNGFGIIDVQLTVTQHHSHRGITKELLERCCRHVQLKLSAVHILEGIDHHILINRDILAHLDSHLVAVYLDRGCHNDVLTF